MAGPSRATILLSLASDVDLFQEPGDDMVYGTVTIDGHAQTWPVKSKGFRRILIARFYAETGAAPGTQAMKDALDALEAKAATEGTRHPVALRIAGDDEAIYLDLCDADCSVVKVTPFGWAVITDPPVRFRRASGMQPLPVPIKGGTLEELSAFVNLTEDDWRLYVAWLLNALRPGVPYCVLCLYGEQGSCKSSLGKITRLLIDPGKAQLRSAPRNEDDLLIAANNGWVCAFDNISGLPGWLSDGLCRLSTGAGQGKRQLYYDLDEILLEARRPVLLTSIEDAVLRGDLLDRGVRLTLPQLPEANRRQEREFWKKFDAQRPRLVGAVLTALSQTMAAAPKVTLAALPRMADFGFWSEAVAIALNWPSGSFTAAYQANIESGHETNIEELLIGPALVRMMTGRDTLWEGTAAELLAKLEELEPELAKRKGWPGSPRKLSGDLRRLAPSLRARGISVTTPNEKSREGHDKRRVITLGSLGSTPAASTAPAASSTTAREDDGSHAAGVAAGMRPVSDPQSAAPNRAADKAGTGAVDAAGVGPQLSDEAKKWED